MWLCFMTARWLDDPLLVIPCSQQVCGCILSLLDVWLILCLSFLALRLYVVVFYYCWMSGWSACHSLLSAGMWLCFVIAGCLADAPPMIPCFQQVCGCVLSLLDDWLILCLSFLAPRMYVVVFCHCWMSGWSYACHSLLSVCMWLCSVPTRCLDDWLIFCLSFLAFSMYVVVFCPHQMSGWSFACHSLLSACMWLCFVPARCLADPLLVMPCSQQVGGCVLSLLDDWLILCLPFLALSLYVVVFCHCWMTGWSSACHFLLSACMWLCFVTAGCLADLLLVILCFQRVGVFFCPCWMSV